MPNIDIKHNLTAVDFSGSGVVQESMDLDAVEWNAVHFTASAGNGMEIVSDGASPPTITWKLGGSSTSFGGDLLPSVDDLYHVGTKLLRWRAGYFARAVSIGATLVLLPNDIKTTSGNLTFSKEGVGSFTWDGSALIPGGAANDIGALANLWRAGYFSSTLSAGSGFQTNALSPALDLAQNARIRVNGQMLLGFDNATVFPDSDITKSLGSPALRWSTLWINTVTASGVTSAGGGFQTNASVSLNPGAVAFTLPAQGTVFFQIRTDNGTNAGNAFLRYDATGNLVINSANAGSLFLQLDQGADIRSKSIFPHADNTYDLGAIVPGNARWRVGYFASAVSVGGTSWLTPTTISAGSGGFQTNSTVVAGSTVTGRDFTTTDNANAAYRLKGRNVDGSFTDLYNSGGGNLQVWVNNASVLGLQVSAAGLTSAAGGFETNASVGLDVGNLGKVRAFRYDSPTGLELVVAVGGTDRAQFGSTVFRPVAPNSMDLGITGSNTFKDAFFAGGISAGGTSGQTHYFKSISNSIVGWFESNSTTGIVRFVEGGVFRGIIGYGDNGGILTGQTTDSMVIRAEGDLFFAAGGDNLGVYLNSAKVLSVGGGFQTNSTTILAYGTSAILTNAARDQFNPNPDNGVALGVSSQRWSQVVAGTSGFIVHDGTFVRSQVGLTVTAGSGFRTDAQSILGDINPNVDNSNSLGTSTKRYNTLWALNVNGGTNSITFATTAADILFAPTGGAVVRPTTDNAVDFGSAAARWKHGFFAATVSAAQFTLYATGAVSAQTLIFQRTDAGAPNATLRWRESDGTFRSGIGSNFNITDSNGNIELLNGTTTRVNISGIGSVGVGFGTVAPSGAQIMAQGTISAGTGFATSVSNGMAFGGNASTAITTLGSATRAIPVTVNGTTMFIPLYAGVS